MKRFGSTDVYVSEADKVSAHNVPNDDRTRSLKNSVELVKIAVQKVSNPTQAGLSCTILAFFFTAVETSVK